MTSDGLVFLVAVALIVEFVLGIAVQRGEILPITLGPQLAMSSTVVIGVAIWGIFPGKETQDTIDAWVPTKTEGFCWWGRPDLT